MLKNGDVAWISLWETEVSHDPFSSEPVTCTHCTDCTDFGRTGILVSEPQAADCLLFNLVFPAFLNFINFVVSQRCSYPPTYLLACFLPRQSPCLRQSLILYMFSYATPMPLLWPLTQCLWWYCASRFSLVHLIIHLHYLLRLLYPSCGRACEWHRISFQVLSVRERGQLTKFLARLDRRCYLALISLKIAEEIRTIFPGTEELIVQYLSGYLVDATPAKRKTYPKWPMTCSAPSDVIVRTTCKSWWPDSGTCFPSSWKRVLGTVTVQSRWSSTRSALYRPRPASGKVSTSGVSTRESKCCDLWDVCVREKTRRRLGLWYERDVFCAQGIPRRRRVDVSLLSSTGQDRETRT